MPFVGLSNTFKWHGSNSSHKHYFNSSYRIGRQTSSWADFIHIATPSDVGGRLYINITATDPYAQQDHEVMYPNPPYYQTMALYWIDGTSTTSTRYEITRKIGIRGDQTVLADKNSPVFVPQLKSIAVKNFNGPASNTTCRLNTVFLEWD